MPCPAPPAPIAAAGRRPLRPPARRCAPRTTRCASSSPPSPSRGEAETVVLMLDARHRGSTCLVCRGASSAEQVAALVPILVQSAAQEPALAAVVLATVRARRGHRRQPRPTTTPSAPCATSSLLPASTCSTGSCSTTSSSPPWPSSPGRAGAGPARSPHGEGPPPLVVAANCRVSPASPARVLEDGGARLPASGTPRSVHRHRGVRARPGRVPWRAGGVAAGRVRRGRGRCASIGRPGCPTAPPTTSTGTWSRAYAALGLLNDAAVSGARRDPHDGVAALARFGTAGLVGLVGAGRPDVPDRAGVRLALLDKPAGQPYSILPSRPREPPPHCRRVARAGCAR